MHANRKIKRAGSFHRQSQDHPEQNQIDETGNKHFEIRKAGKHFVQYHEPGLQIYLARVLGLIEKVKERIDRAAPHCCWHK